jgi:hypothetical protein
MKLPEIRGPRGSSPGSGGLKMPSFVNDLYRDMRDRRLLIPAVALLVAILALPVVLASEPEPVVPAAPVPPDPKAAALEPAVLAVQETGVRDFRERLDALNQKNPFGDRFAPDPEAAASSGDLVAPVESSTPTEVSPAGPAVPEAPVVEPPPAPGTPDDPDDPEDPGSFVLVPRIDVKVGIVGRERRQRIENVKSGELLPGEEAPTAMFLGNAYDEEYAELLVSRDVTRVGGDGKCKPANEDCEFLRLADGERAVLAYEPNGKRYSIQITSIYFVRVDEDKFNAED